MAAAIEPVPTDNLRGFMDTPELAAAIAALGAETVARRLATRLTPERRERIEAALRSRVDSLHVAIEATHDPHNAAAVLRTAEALGVGTVHMIATKIPLSRRITRGSSYWAETREHGDWGAFVAALPPGMQVAGACVDVGTVELAAVPVDRPMCIVFGSEQAGISAQARAGMARACWSTHSTPMPMAGRDSAATGTSPRASRPQRRACSLRSASAPKTWPMQCAP